MGEWALRDRCRIVLAALVLSVGSLPGLAFAQKTEQTLPSQSPKLAAAQAEILSLLEQLQTGDVVGSMARLDAVVAGPDFKDLDEDGQYVLLTLQAAGAHELGQYPKAFRSYRRLTELRPADADAWLGRIEAAHRAEDYAEAASTLIAMSERSDDAFDRVEKDYIARLASTYVLGAPNGRAVQARLIDALFARGWDEDVSGLWTLRAAQLLDAGQADRAGPYVAKVTSARHRLAMSIDRRFDPLRADTPELFDVTAALDTELQQAREAAEAPDANLEVASDYARELTARGRFEEALSVLDAAMPDGGPVKTTDPVPDPDHLIWAMDARSRILSHLGRHEEALAELRRAARRPESGSQNVSHAINLGSLYVQMDRPEDGLEAVGDLDASRLAAYGRMQKAQVEACAQHALGQEQALKTTLAFLNDHRSDDPSALESVAACMGDEDAAASALIARLEAPERRMAALGEVQTYLPDTHSTPGTARSLAFRQALLARSDVRAAIERHGRIETWPIRAPLTF